ncbi:hypothetical protein B0J12DRAFT_59515 [Macrophomina phaseolina]|uniref:HNH nuclease domain-containing protein n=1 Tax=Macrophomina phaseolina TaxID=35725 RepID=A0ABQ8FSU3_9PEZI|nr:hypothetical protein B0J12DRAFT_59515 [Macrophomina phaseolina]
MAAAAFALREPVAPGAGRGSAGPELPIPINNTSCRVAFRHPAYPDFLDQNVFLTLYAWDAAPRGLHARTALLACSILAANAADGYLMQPCPDGTRVRVPIDADTGDGLLTGPEYYFFVPPPTSSATPEPYKYPVCPSFRDWVFPRTGLQSLWDDAADASQPDDAESASASVVSASSATAAVLARDRRRCLLSRSGDYVQRAHLCPRAETEWFMRNRMVSYNVNIDLSGDSITDDLANAITLRADIHTAFDDCRFVLIPKAGAWVPHFLDATIDLGLIHHNTPVALPSQVSPAFLLARFAWALFPKMRHFFESGPPKAVLVLEEMEDGLRQVHKDMSNVDAMARAKSTGRGRSASPKKRKADPSAPLPDVTETKHVRRDAVPPRASADAAGHNDDAFRDATGQQNAFDDVAAQSSIAEHEEAAEAVRLARLKRLIRTARRPRDAALLCCDYAEAEKLTSLGVPGKAEFGGGHLCWQCLGGEPDEESDGSRRLQSLDPPLTPPLSHSSGPVKAAALGSGPPPN